MAEGGVSADGLSGLGLEEERTLSERGLAFSTLMGEGSYSRVLKCAVTRTTARLEAAQDVAVKIIDRTKASDRFLSTFLPRELAISARMDHANVARTLDHFTVLDKTYVVMELAAGGDMEQYISSRGALVDRSEATDLPHAWFRQVLDGVEYIHAEGFVHRDLKCENLFLAGDVVKIGDFGFSREMGPDDTSTTFCGSRAYASPELMQQQPYKGRDADCWSLGVILFIMLEARMPFDDRNGPKMIRRQLSKSIPYSKKTKTNARALVGALMEPDRAQRLSATAAKEHVWFTAAAAATPEALEP